MFCERIARCKAQGLRFYRHARRFGLGFARGAWGDSTTDPFVKAFEAMPDMPEAPTVMDVGANTGQFCGAMLLWRPQSRVYSVEPLMTNVDLLRKRFGARPAVSVHRVAISNHNGTAPLFVTRATDGSSLQPSRRELIEAFPQYQGDGRESVPTQTMDGF